MPDLSVPYTLTTPGGTIIFNEPLVPDTYYISDINGLVGAPIRAPIDPVAFGDGSKGYNFWKGGRHVLIEGNFLVTSLAPCAAMVAIWNTMEEALRVALNSISGETADTATLVWTPLGLSQRTLTVRNDVALESQPDQNYLARTFTFGLFSEEPEWTEN